MATRYDPISLTHAWQLYKPDSVTVNNRRGRELRMGGDKGFTHYLPVSQLFADFISPIIEFTCLFCQWVPQKTRLTPPGATSQARAGQACPNPRRDSRFIQNFRAREEVPTLQILHACRDWLWAGRGERRAGMAGGVRGMQRPQTFAFCQCCC